MFIAAIAERLFLGRRASHDLRSIVGVAPHFATNSPTRLTCQNLKIRETRPFTRYWPNDPFLTTGGGYDKASLFERCTLAGCFHRSTL